MRIILNNRYFDPNDSAGILTEGENQTWVQEVVDTLKCWKEGHDVQIQTSGSTGKPKIITHSHRSMFRSAEKTISYFNLTSENLLWCSLPAKYIAGKMMIIRALVGNMDLLITKPSSNPLIDLDREVDFAAMTPMQLAIGINANKNKLKGVNQLILGGGPVDILLESQLQGLDTRVYHTYGMTETITHVAVRGINGSNSTDYFKALEGVRFSMSSSETLVISADHLLEAHIETTDSVELLDEFSFRWKGRIDNVINSGGLKIQPEELERSLAPLISNRFFVSSIPDAILGEKVVLVIEGLEYDRLHLTDKIAQVLAKQQVPKTIFFVDKMMETPTGKIKRDLSLYDL